MRLRPLPATVVAAFALACVPAAAGAATARHPDLRTLAPSGLQLADVTYGGRSFKALRFDNTAWNAGQGALELRGSTGGGAPVLQRIYDDAGGWTEVKVADDLVYHPTHKHFHFPDFARYELWTRAGWDGHLASGRRSGSPAYGGAKVSFCLMDTGLVQNLAGTPSGARYSTCGQSVQGISVGWGDTYGAGLDEQWVDLGSTWPPDGRYVLRSVADPLNRLFESASRGDAAREGAAANEGLTAFSIKKRRIRLE